jgi:rhodanese-related sulfurtransferase
MTGRFSRFAGAIASAVAAIGGFACGASSEIQEVPAGARIVDVRTPSEYQEGHFPGAVNIPVDRIGGRLAELGPKDGPIVVYCRSGHRAGAAKAILERGGFTNVVNGGGLTQMMRLAPPTGSTEQ